ncbi:MAG: hypothetical protein B9S32_09140 [Verrucomicrobia bacterium Tous-C9LFEB]|nr:MAG: hypothetical protein B9S32_09140 [Verrucomicrobia bacterium Tous-C9LFEB]
MAWFTKNECMSKQISSFWRGLAVLIWTGWVATAMPVCGEENLVRNGELAGGSSKGVPEWSFKTAHKETFKNGWKPNPGGMGGMVFITCMAADEKGGNEWWWQQVECESGREFLLTVEARSEGSEHKAEIGVELIGGEKNYEYKRIATVADTQANAPQKYSAPDWKEFSGKFMVPAGVTKVNVRLGLMSKDAAEAGYRNVRLEKR